MKKSIIILTLALGISSMVQAIHPMEFTDLEADIVLQDWMLTTESFFNPSEVVTELELEVASWMIEASWGQDDLQLASEDKIILEDWMLNTFYQDKGVIALEDWMLNIAG